MSTTAYIAHFRSLLEYGSTVWDPYIQQDIDNLEKVPKASSLVHQTRLSLETTRLHDQHAERPIATKPSTTAERKQTRYVIQDLQWDSAGYFTN